MDGPSNHQQSKTQSIAHTFMQMYRKANQIEMKGKKRNAREKLYFSKCTSEMFINKLYAGV